jgi:hypothetical protein
VGFSGRLEAGPHCEDLRWTRALFRNVGLGDAAGLCRQARLFRDVDGAGAGYVPVLLCVAIALGCGRRRLDSRGGRDSRGQRWTALAALVLGLALLSPSCGGGGGGGGSPAPDGASSLQLRLEAATFQGADSGQECELEGLPVTAWTIPL